MKIQYLGTAAAEGIPAVFCDCEVCKKSRENGGKNIRTRSQAIIDDKILIDFPADTYYHSLINGIELSKISTCIITHDHLDHLHPDDIWTRSKGIAHTNEPALVMYGTYPSYIKIMNAILNFRMDEQNVVIPKRVEPFISFEAQGYKITPLAADHDFKCEPVFYMIEKDGKAILYAHDTGVFPDETWEYLKDHPVRFDLVSLDCTEPMKETYRSHMGLGAVKCVRERLTDLGLTDRDTKFVLNHFSHNGEATYDQLVPIAEKDGFLVSYDGMCVEF